MSGGTQLRDRPQQRRIYRCVRCSMVQFETNSGRCRKCCCAVLKREHDTDQCVFPQHQSPLMAAKGIGRQIRILREGRGIASKDFANLLRPHISRSCLYRIESGCIKPSLGTLERIAEILDVPLGAFFLHPESLNTLGYAYFVQQIVPLLRFVPDRSLDTILSFVRRMSGKHSKREVLGMEESAGVRAGQQRQPEPTDPTLAT
jgi:transcriptional regulator with XRE-family HTH domain